MEPPYIQPFLPPGSNTIYIPMPQIYFSDASFNMDFDGEPMEISVTTHAQEEPESPVIHKIRKNDAK